MLFGIFEFVVNVLISVCCVILMVWLLCVLLECEVLWIGVFVFGGIVLMVVCVFVIDLLCGIWLLGNMMLVFVVGFVVNVVWGFGVFVFMCVFMLDDVGDE